MLRRIPKPQLNQLSGFLNLQSVSSSIFNKQNRTFSTFILILDFLRDVSLSEPTLEADSLSLSVPKSR
jgi:hypothetical protein